MTKNDILEIEQALNIKLNDDYIEAAQGDLCENTILWSKIFYKTSKRLISTNLRLRKNGIYGIPLKHTHFVFAKQDDAYYFIDTLASDTTVYWAPKYKYCHYDPDDFKDLYRFFSVIEMVEYFHKHDLKT